MADEDEAARARSPAEGPRPPTFLDTAILAVTLIVLIVMTIALFGVGATEGPLQVALISSAVVAGLVALKATPDVQIIAPMCS